MTAQKDTVLAATRDLVHAVDELNGMMRERLPARLVEPRGYQAFLAVPRGVALALRFCVNADTGESLAQQLKPVPPEFVTRAPEGVVIVRCLCGASHMRQELVECPGGCGRWFVGDESGVWAWRAPEQAA